MRVQTGCRDCKRCTDSAAAEAGRKLGKLTADVMTGGGVAAVQAFTGTCRACAHKTSLHGGIGAALPVQVTAPVPYPAPFPVAPPPPPGPPPGWYPSPYHPGYVQSNHVVPDGRPHDMLCGMFPLRQDEIPGPRRAPAIWRTMLNIDRGLVGMVGRLVVSGAVPPELRGRPLLMAANHIGVFDAFVLMAACKRIGINPRFMLAGGILDAPVIGPALRVSGHLRVDRQHAATAVEQFTEAVEALRTTREPIIVYPEGRISHDPGLWPERGKTGAARLALAADVPVIPISQWGAHEAVYWGTETVNGPADLVPLARSGLSAPLRRPKFKVHFGAPVDLSDVEPERPGAGVRAHAKIMQAITDGLAPLRRDEPVRPRFNDPTRPTDTTSPWKPGPPQARPE